MKLALFAAVALAPISLCLATTAAAQTTITGVRNTPVQTSNVNAGAAANVVVDTGAVVSPTAAGTAITIDSSNTVTNNGTITFNDLSDVTGVRLLGGFTGSLTNNGAINLLEGTTISDADNDGDLDGAFAVGSRRVGVALSGSGAFTGNVALGTASFINIEGVDSIGVSLGTQLTGSLTNAGAITVFGDRGTGILSAAPITGDFRTTGAVNVTGAGSQGIVLAGPVSGAVVIQGGVTATGYRYSSRPQLPTTRAALDADDLLQGGSALRIAGDVAGGVLLDAPPQDLSTTDTDEDDDGVLDANETIASVRSFGAAPAMVVGAAGANITLGVVGAGANAYGLVIRGNVQGDGVYDGVSGTGLQIGQAGGSTTTLQNGLSVQTGSSVSATGFSADATAIRLNAGAIVREIINGGTIGAAISSEGLNTVTAIDIGAGATVNTLRNTGSLTAEVQGERGSAAVIVDRSGTLSLVENTGTIAALITASDDALDLDDPNSDPSDEIISGQRTAFDLRANTTGTTIRQTGRVDADTGVDTDGDGVEDIDEPFMSGSILFGSGDDRLEVLNGAVVGDIAFGAGADQLTVNGGASVIGGVTDTDGRLAINVQNGSLQITNAATINGTSLNVGTDGALVFTADAASGASTRLVLSGAATIASGAQVGLRLSSLQRTAQEYRVLTANTLSVGTLDTSLLGQAPYLYIVNTRVDQGANTLFIGVRPRTAVELELNRSETQAFDAVFNSLDLNDRIESAVLGQTSREGLINLFDQLLPDHSGGALLSLSAVNDALSNVLSSRTEPRGRVGPNGAWAQEVFFNLRQDRRDAQGFESQGFGVTGGFEGVGPDGGALGLTASFVTADFEDTDAAVGEQVSFSMFEVGGYWHRQWGGLRFDARAAGGVVLFDSERRFVSAADNLLLQSEADWLGYSASGHLGLSYEYGSRFYVRPFASLDGVYLREGGYEEEGGGVGFDLDVDSRSGALLSASGGLTAGARFGGETWFGPELTVGYRTAVAGDPGETTAAFRGGAPTRFTLDAEDVDGGGLQIRIALRTGSNRGYLALETGGEIRDDYERYDIRIVAKVIF